METSKQTSPRISEHTFNGSKNPHLKSCCIYLVSNFHSIFLFLFSFHVSCHASPLQVSSFLPSLPWLSQVHEKVNVWREEKMIIQFQEMSREWRESDQEKERKKAQNEPRIWEISIFSFLFRFWRKCFEDSKRWRDREQEKGGRKKMKKKRCGVQDLRVMDVSWLASSSFLHEKKSL